MRAYYEERGLTHCFRCEGWYKPSPNWWTVSYPRGDTSGRYNLGRNIPKEYCPICEEPPRLEPYPQLRAM